MQTGEEDYGLPIPVFPRSDRRGAKDRHQAYEERKSLEDPCRVALRPERNLLASVLAFAFLDLQKNREQSIRNLAYQWLMGRDSTTPKDYPFRMDNICLHLEFDIETTRRIATQMYNDPSRMEW